MMEEGLSCDGAPVTILIVGAGDRGTIYSTYALERPSLCTVVAVADRMASRRRRMASAHRIVPDMVFSDWRDIRDSGVDERLSKAVVIALQDRDHHEAALYFAHKGYHILLEKPMAVTASQCRDIVDAVNESHVIFAIGHVLRYTPYSRKMKALVESDVIGDIVSIQHLEPVGWYHFAHSYVRGNWRREDESSFSLLAKSCHDIDWIHWMMGKKCVAVASFGSLNHFKSDHAPSGASDRCVHCPSSIERSCPYSAIKTYLDPVKRGEAHVFVRKIVEDEPTVENVTKALNDGPYGRCVYACDNDVVDNQVVILNYHDGSTASFSMMAFTEEVCERKTRIFGTKGELVGTGQEIHLFQFATQESTTYIPESEFSMPKTKMTNHGCGDFFLMQDFINAVRHNDASHLSSTPEETLTSHLLVFEAEMARKTSTVVSPSLEW